MKEKNLSLVLRAGEAFGSGGHESTQAALSLIQSLSKAGARFTNVLDVGCGSGVLGLLAAKLWQCPVLAVDIEPKAVDFTLENARANRLEPYVTALRSDGYAHPAIADRAPYDLVLCNMLAESILAFANDLNACLAPGGSVILSGILVWLLGPVLEAHQALGLELVAEIPAGDWRTVLLRKLISDPS